MSPAIDETGNRYGMIVVVERVGHIGPQIAWRCECDCGGSVVEKGIALRSGRRHSCGCRKRDHRLKHGATGGRGRAPTPAYRAWARMRQRCMNPRNDNYANYGGRGITIDPRWDDFAVFLADVGERPPNPAGWASRKPYWTLDRIDNDGSYAPGNVRWAGPVVQSNNQRRRVSNTEHARALLRIAELEAEIRKLVA